MENDWRKRTADTNRLTHKEEKRLERQRNREKGTKKRLSRKEVCVGGRQDGRKKGRYANLYTYR